MADNNGRRLSRLGRAFAAFAKTYRSQPDELRARLETALREAAALLSTLKELPPSMRKEFFELLVDSVIEGKVGGSWRKVREAIENGWPEIWPLVRDRIPADGRDLDF